MQAVTVESRYSSELSGLDFAFYFALLNCSCGICSLLSVLCWTTGIQHFVSEPNLRLLDCFFSSSLGLWDLSLRRHAIVNNLVDELRLVKFRRLCVFMWGQLHDCDGLFQNRQWHTHIDNLFVESLWRELRLRLTVFAGVVDVTHRITWLPFV